MLASIVQASIGNFITGKYLGAEYVAVFGIAMLLLRYFRQFIIQATGVLRPRFAALEGASEHEKLRALFLKAISNTAILAFGLGAMIIIMGGRFVMFWVGEDFAGTIPVLWILIAGYAFALAQSPAVGLLYALNMHKYYAMAIAVETAAIIGLSIILTPAYGLIGIALGITIPLLVMRFFQMIYTSYVAGVKLFEYIKAIGLPFVISAITVLMAFSLGVITNYREFSVAVSILYGIVFIVVIAVFSLSISDSVTRSFCSRFINRYTVSVGNKQR
jgi:O-antigen/teichoic acid export membrane protein